MVVFISTAIFGAAVAARTCRELHRNKPSLGIAAWVHAPAGCIHSFLLCFRLNDVIAQEKTREMIASDRKKGLILISKIVRFIAIDHHWSLLDGKALSLNPRTRTAWAIACSWASSKARFTVSSNAGIHFPHEGVCGFPGSLPLWEDLPWSLTTTFSYLSTCRS